MTTASTVPMLVSKHGRTYRLLGSQEAVIGSSGCAVLLSEPGVLLRHARVVFDQGTPFIEDLGGGVMLNGRKITARTALNSGDKIGVGTAELIFQAGAIPVTPKPVPQQAVTPAYPTQVVPTPQPQVAPRKQALPAHGARQPAPLQPLVQRTPPQPIPQPSKAQPMFQPIGSPGAQPIIPQQAPPVPAILVLPAQMSYYGQPKVQGTVVHVDGPHMEEPDFNLLLFLLKVVLWMFLFPILIWNPNLISLMLLGRKDTKLPTRYVRVKDGNGQEHMVRMKGDLVCGTVGMGDVVSFWGRHEAGTLHMNFAFNHKLNAEVRLR